MTQKTKIFLKIILLTVVGIFSVNFIRQHPDAFKKIWQLEFLEFVNLSALILVGFALQGYVLKILLEYFNIKLSVKEWFGLRILNTYSNYLFIKGGPVVKGIYLKKNYNLKYSCFLLVLIYQVLLQLGCASFIALLGAFYQYQYYGSFNLIIFAFFVCVLLAVIVIFLLPERIISKFKMNDPDINLVEYVNIFKSKKILIKCSILGLASVLLMCYRIFLMQGMIFEPIPFSLAVIIVTAGIFSGVIALTPAALGIREAIMAYTASVTGGSLIETATVGSLDRGLTMMWIFPLGIVLSIWYSKNSNLK
ncbi:MAG: lysylphosphatidylglycerol synthase domain-containing protein [Candidatus Omnitrophota bacterium]